MGTASEQVSTVVVGAGVCGLQACSRLSREGVTDVVLLEKQPGLGGVWAASSWANSSSRVQISEPNYRMVSENVTEEFTPRQELLGQMHALTQQDDFSVKIRYGASVVSVRPVDSMGLETHDDSAAHRVCVTYIDADSGATHIIEARDHVLLCTGGLQTPKTITLPTEGLFGGEVIVGISSEVDSIDLQGRRVCVLGMGAFAVENARTALLQGAEHVTIVARGLNLVIPRLLLAMSTLQAGAETLYRPRDPPLPADSAAAQTAQEAAAKRIKAMLAVLSTPYLAADAEHLLPTGVRTALAAVADPENGSAVRISCLLNCTQPTTVGVKLKVPAHTYHQAN